MTKELYRKAIFSNLPLSGYYRYKDIFQILPPKQTWLKPRMIRGDWPFSLEYYIDTSKIKKPKRAEDYFHDSKIVQEQFDKLIKALSTITNYRFFEYTNKQGWFTSLSKSPSFASSYGQTFYYSKRRENFFQKQDHSKFVTPFSDVIKKINITAYMLQDYIQIQYHYLISPMIYLICISN